MRGQLFLPVNPTASITLLLLLTIIQVLIFTNLAQLGFLKLGFSPLEAFTLLSLSFFGSVVNLPIYKWKTPKIVVRTYRWFFFTYQVPVAREEHSILAVNLGGCLVPLFVSTILLHKLPANHLPRLLLAIIFVALVTHHFSRVIQGVGVVVPMFIPPLTSATIAILVSREYPSAIAYVAGSVGTLIGADLMNLGRIKEMHAPISSIGGAGVWDGIFLSSVVAALLV